MSLPAEPRCMVKLGGSLLDDPHVAGRLRTWLAGNTGFAHVIICGGGALVETLRGLYRTHAIAERDAHWCAIRLMDECTRLVAGMVPAIPLATGAGEIPSHGNCFLLCYGLLRERSALECSWNVTSDSLAAELADFVGARELCLLKSSAPPAGGPAQWAANGWVDPVFPKVAARLDRVIGVNLRGVDPAA